MFFNFTRYGRGSYLVARNGPAALGNELGGLLLDLGNGGVDVVLRACLVSHLSGRRGFELNIFQA